MATDTMLRALCAPISDDDDDANGRRWRVARGLGEHLFSVCARECERACVSCRWPGVLVDAVWGIG